MDINNLAELRKLNRIYKEKTDLEKELAKQEDDVIRERKIFPPEMKSVDKVNPPSFGVVIAYATPFLIFFAVLILLIVVLASKWSVSSAAEKLMDDPG